MYRIVPAIANLEQHLQTLILNPERYRPESCQQCGRGKPWCHGHYEGKADWRGGILNPIPVPRFLCPGFGQSCSRLPSCIAPRRWYDWAMQHAVLLSVLLGQSLRGCAGSHGVDRRTVGRWWQWLQARSEPFYFHLRSHWIEWGRAADWRGFWGLSVAQRPLREIMAWLDSRGIVIP